RKDDYYYALVVGHHYRKQKEGTCVMRTRDLADPGSWRAWDGDGYNVSFVDPYKPGTTASQDHLCAPVSPDKIGTMSSSLTYNTYFQKFLLVATGSAYDAAKRRTV